MIRCAWILLSCFLCVAAWGQQTGRYLYLSTPDGAQKQSGSGVGILVFDIDDGHKLVRRIDVPEFEEGLRGFAGNLKTHTAYFSTDKHRVGAFDLETERVVWNKTYEQGADRSAVSLDGTKIYAPTGWWYRGNDSGMLVLDAATGEQLDWIKVGPQAHNAVVSLDGKRLYLGTETTLSIFDTATDKMIRQIPNVGESGIFPYTFDKDQRIGYICLGRHVGFDVVNLETGEVLHRVFAAPQSVTHRTHGAALTPDGKELWISDQEGRKLFIFDATKMPPEPAGSVDLSTGGHGWVTFSMDGHYAWTHSPDVFDAKTKKLVATLRDENGEPVSGSKFLEIHFRDGKVVAMGHEFGLGR